jgi:hypothetical protein
LYLSQTYVNGFNGKAIVGVRELSSQEFQDQCNSTYGQMMMKIALQTKNLTISTNRTLLTTESPTTTTKKNPKNLFVRRKRSAIKGGPNNNNNQLFGPLVRKKRAPPATTTPPILETTPPPDKPSVPTLLTNEIRTQSFSEDYYIRFMTGGCYYRDVKTYQWSSIGVCELEKTNIQMTCCQTTHLTEFAGKISSS